MSSSGRSTRRFRAAIIGAGRIAGGLDEARAGDAPLTHAGAYKKNPRIDLVACVEPDADRRAAFLTHWGVERGYADIETMLAQEPALDLVSVCAPSREHEAALGALAASATRAVLVEKPGARSGAALSALSQLYENAGKTLQVNYTRRFDPSMAELRERLASGALGAVRSVVAHYDKGLRNNGSHAVDLIGWLLGGAFKVHAARVSREDGPSGDPTIDAIFMLGDATVHLAGGHSGDYALFELRVTAERGVIDLEDAGMRIVERTPTESAMFAGYRQPGARVIANTGYQSAMSRAIDNTLRALEGLDPPLCSGSAAASTLRRVDAIQTMAMSC